MLATTDNLAAQLYEENHQDVLNLLAMLKGAIESHAQKANNDGIDMSHVHELYHYRTELIELAAPLTDRDRDDVEDAIFNQRRG